MHGLTGVFAEVVLRKIHSVCPYARLLFIELRRQLYVSLVHRALDVRQHNSSVHVLQTWLLLQSLLTTPPFLAAPR